MHFSSTILTVVDQDENDDQITLFSFSNKVSLETYNTHYFEIKAMFFHHKQAFFLYQALNKLK